MAQSLGFIGTWRTTWATRKYGGISKQNINVIGGNMKLTDLYIEMAKYSHNLDLEGYSQHYQGEHFDALRVVMSEMIAQIIEEEFHATFPEKADW